MSNRWSGGRDGGRTSKRQLQHLYLVLDDWLSGYSIRKVDLYDAKPPCQKMAVVDLSSDSDSEDSAEPPHQKMDAVSCDGADMRLPPAIFRLEAPRGLPHYFAAAFGTRILAMHPRAAGTDGKLLGHTDFVPFFDVCARGVIFGPRPKPDPVDPIYIPVGDRLFSLGASSFDQLYQPPLEHPGGERWMWSWHDLPKPPFKRRHVTSYALHPDGRTIFVSTERRGAAATFTFDAEAPSLEWKQHGKWMLPFSGRTHFDTELDAWVGLSKDPDTLGHICSCDAVSASSDAGEGQCLFQARKISKEKLFSEDPAETHVGATLVYMGRKSRFCMVQCISMVDDCDDEEQVEEKYVPQPCRHLFRLTMFSLNYDKNGDVTTGKSRLVRYYSMPKVSTEFLKSPVAFWL